MAIPTFTPGEGIETNLRNIKTYQPNGDQAEAGMWNDVANEMGRVAHVFNQIETTRALEKAEQQGIEQGADKGFDPKVLEQEAITSADRAFRKGATASYLSQVDMQTDQALTRINSENIDNPELLRERLNTHIDEVAQNMPTAVALQYKEGAMRQANAYYTNALASNASRVRTQQKTDVMAGLELSEAKLVEMGAPATPEAEQQAALEGAKYRVKLQAAQEAGLLTPNEALVRTQDLQEKLLDGTIYQAVYTAPDRMEFAMKIAEGSSGTDFDQLPVNKRYRAVTVAQQLINAEEAAQRVRDAAVREQVGKQMVDISTNVLTNPQAPGAAKEVERALSIANTPDAVNQAYKLRDYQNNPTDPRFQPLDGEYEAHLAYRAALGELKQSDVNDAFGADMPGNRVGVEGWRKLTTELAGKPDKLVGSNAWKTFTARLEAEFPVPQRSSQGLAALAGSLGLSVNNVNLADGTDGISDKQKTENRRLITQVLRDTQQKISAGDIESEGSLTEYSTKKLGEMRQQFGAGSLTPSNQVKPRGPAAQGAWVVVGSDENARRLYQQYKNDKPGFLRDLNAGKIDRRTANTINRLLNEGEAK